MARITKNENYRVIVEPEDPRGTFFLSTGKISDDEKWRRACNALIGEIKRHVDVGFISLDCDVRKACEHCDAIWTEESATYNGGCCAKDEEANPQNARASQ